MPAQADINSMVLQLQAQGQGQGQDQNENTPGKANAQQKPKKPIYSLHEDMIDKEEFYIKYNLNQKLENREGFWSTFTATNWNNSNQLISSPNI